MNSLRVNRNAISEGSNARNDNSRGASTGGLQRPFQPTFTPREEEEEIAQEEEEPLVDEVMAVYDEYHTLPHAIRNEITLN